MATEATAKITNRDKDQSRHRRKVFYFRICIAEHSDYPDFKTNPTNPLTEMSDEYRMEELVRTLGAIWAETVFERVKKA